MDEYPPLRLMPLTIGSDLLVSMNPSPFSKLLPSESVSREMHRHRAERVNVDAEYLSYPPDEIMRGAYVAGHSLTPEHNYFEIEIVDKGVDSTICIGVCPRDQNLDVQPGSTSDCVAFYIESGSILRNSKSIECVEGCEHGDHIGCGIKFDQMAPGSKVPVFFTRNGKEIGTVKTRVPYKGFYPMVSMNSCGEEVRIMTQMHYVQDEDVMMSVDSCEDEWYRLSDIKLNGPILEYKGRGKSIVDVGLAQAKLPLNTTNHYFEIEIMDPGENCYIAIGLTNREFPKYRHPGWNKGSIGYHADDGKIFIGSGVGEPFGPRCHKGDRMGCGIYFPRDFEPQDCELGVEDIEDEEEDEELQSMRRLRATKMGNNSPNSPSAVANLIGIEDDSEEDDEWEYEDGKSNAPFVEVFFTRNSKLIGKKRVLIPKGGFYPTVGMLSIDEKVRVDLHPMSG